MNTRTSSIDWFQPFGIFFLLLAGVGSALAETPAWLNFEYDGLLDKHSQHDRDYLRFLNRSSMSMGLYRLAAGATDAQQPHDRDEGYYVTRGSATLIIDNQRHPVHDGSIAFVRANIAHRFVDISDDLDVLVVFVSADSDPENHSGEVFHLTDLRSAAESDKNVWNPFLQVSSMRFGLYLLPLAVGGDDPLTHKVDEVNIVVKSKARFHVGENVMDVVPGSVVYVASGNAHYFDHLSDDFEVLILFATQPDND